MAKMRIVLRRIVTLLPKQILKQFRLNWNEAGNIIKQLTWEPFVSDNDIQVQHYAGKDHNLVVVVVMMKRHMILQLRNVSNFPRNRDFILVRRMLMKLMTRMVQG